MKNTTPSTPLLSGVLIPLHQVSCTLSSLALSSIFNSNLVAHMPLLSLHMQPLMATAHHKVTQEGCLTVVVMADRVARLTVVSTAIEPAAPSLVLSVRSASKLGARRPCAGTVLMKISSLSHVVQQLCQTRSALTTIGILILMLPII
jgi:hypothetical protein